LSNLAEIKQRIIGLKKTLAGMGDKATSTALVVSVVANSKPIHTILQERLTSMLKAVSPELQDRFKKEGARLGFGAVAGVFGLMMMAIGALYLLYVLTLVVDLALHRLWLSALIVIGGTIIGGGIVAMIGAVTMRSSAKHLQQAADDASKGATELTEATFAEARKEVKEIQALVKLEVEDRKRQALELLGVARRIAPPAVAVMFLLLLIRRRRKRRKALAAEAPVVIREVVYAEE
jgi:hypothetical protein